MMQRANKNTEFYIFEQLEQLEKECISDGWSANGFKSEAGKDHGIVLYIVENNTIIALLSAYIAIDEANITNVAVKKTHRNKGYAKKLVAELQNILPLDVKNIFLEVRESNLSAKNLYLKCGFKEIALRKNFYSNPNENAIIMKKKVEN